MKENNDFIKKKKLIDFKNLNLWGQGSYAKVYKSITKDKDFIAIKVYDKLKICTESRIKNLKNEIEVFKFIKNDKNPLSKYFVNYYDNLEDNENYYIWMEYIDGITLKEYLNRNFKNGILKKDLIIIFKKLLKAMNYLHKNYIYHRDLKLSNIMIKKNNDIKIIDFGFSIKINKYEKLQKFLGTFNYLSPEILLKRKYYGDKNDIWALGVILYKLLTGYYPFKGSDKNELKSKIIYINFYKEFNFDKIFKNIFDSIFVFKPKNRKNTKELYRIIYLNS